MTRDPTNPAGPPPHRPVLEYRTPIQPGQLYRPPRKPLPTGFCVGFGSASIVIAIVWAFVQMNFVAHAATRIVITIGLIGLVFCAMKETRLAGLSILLAAAAWYLMIAFCLTIGIVPARVF